MSGQSTPVAPSATPVHFGSGLATVFVPPPQPRGSSTLLRPVGAPPASPTDMMPASPQNAPVAFNPFAAPPGLGSGPPFTMPHSRTTFATLPPAPWLQPAPANAPTHAHAPTCTPTQQPTNAPVRPMNVPAQPPNAITHITPEAARQHNMDAINVMMDRIQRLSVENNMLTEQLAAASSRIRALEAAAYRTSTPELTRNMATFGHEHK